MLNPDLCSRLCACIALAVVFVQGSCGVCIHVTPGLAGIQAYGTILPLIMETQGACLCLWSFCLDFLECPSLFFSTIQTHKQYESSTEAPSPLLMNFILAGASPLHYYSIGFKPHHLTLNYTGRTDAEAPILWPPGVKNCSLEKTLMLGKTEGRRRRMGWQQRKRWLDSVTDSMDMNLSKSRNSEGQGCLVCLSRWGGKESGMTYQLQQHILLHCLLLFLDYQSHLHNYIL